MNRGDIFLVVIVFFTFLLSVSLLFYAGMNKNVVTYEYECVDGFNNKNLNGIMCEGEDTYYFGMGLQIGYFSIAMVGFISFVSGLLSLVFLGVFLGSVISNKLNNHNH